MFWVVMGKIFLGFIIAWILIAIYAWLKWKGR